MNTNSKTSLFLMELIIVILFFSISAVVCVQLFVNAYSTNESTKKIAQATVIVQNLAEQFLGCDGDPGAVRDLYGTGSALRLGDTEAVISLGYDEAWNEVSADVSPVYVASISIADEKGDPYVGDNTPEAGSMEIATVEVYEVATGTCIASQDVKYHVPYRLEAGR